MDKEIIKEISKAVFNESILKNWVFYLIIVFVSAVGTFFANFLSMYARKRGENLATKADLEDIKSRLRATTEITEKIKNEIEHQTWRKKEVEVLKRQKLEDYLCYIYVVQESLHTEMKNAFFYENESYDVYAFNKANMLRTLYIPELANEHADFCAKYAEFKKWIANGMTELLAKRKSGEQKPVISTEHMTKHKKLLDQLYTSTLVIEVKAAQTAQELNEFQGHNT